MRVNVLVVIGHNHIKDLQKWDSIVLLFRLTFERTQAILYRIPNKLTANVLCNNKCLLV
jgi:hypothetical protein